MFPFCRFFWGDKNQCQHNIYLILISRWKTSLNPKKRSSRTEKSYWTQKIPLNTMRSSWDPKKTPVNPMDFPIFPRTKNHFRTKVLRSMCAGLCGQGSGSWRYTDKLNIYRNLLWCHVMFIINIYIYINLLINYSIFICISISINIYLYIDGPGPLWGLSPNSDILVHFGVSWCIPTISLTALVGQWCRDMHPVCIRGFWNSPRTWLVGCFNHLETY